MAGTVAQSTFFFISLHFFQRTYRVAMRFFPGQKYTINCEAAVQRTLGGVFCGICALVSQTPSMRRQKFSPWQNAPLGT
jgi:hypothetical protein